MTPGDRVAKLHPQALGTHFVAFYDMNGLQWDYSLIAATTRLKNTSKAENKKIVYKVILDLW
jgi:hypothetical protein